MLPPLKPRAWGGLKGGLTGGMPVSPSSFSPYPWLRSARKQKMSLDGGR